MVTTRYSDKQGFKSRQNPFQVQPTENIGNFSASRRCLCFWYTSYSSFSCLECCQHLFQNRSYKIERILSDVLPIQQVIRSDTMTRSFPAAFGVLREDKLCDTLQTMTPTNQCQNDSSNLLTPYREQPRTTLIVVAYPRPGNFNKIVISCLLKKCTRFWGGTWNYCSPVELLYTSWNFKERITDSPYTSTNRLAVCK